MLRMSQFGIIEMTRQRMRPSLKRSIYNDCPHCKGAGLLKTPESMSLDVMRRLAIGAHDERVVRVELAVCPDVAFYLQNKKRAEIAALEQESGKRVIVRGDAAMGLDESKFELYDSRDGLVLVPELGMTAAEQAAPQHAGGRGGHQQQGGGQQQGGQGRGGRRRGGRGRGGRDDQRGEQRGGGGRGGRDDRSHQDHEESRHDERPSDDHYDVESAEEQVDEREEERAEQAAADAGIRAPIHSHESQEPIAYSDDDNELAEAPAAIEDEVSEDRSEPVHEPEEEE